MPYNHSSEGYRNQYGEPQRTSRSHEHHKDHMRAASEYTSRVASSERPSPKYRWLLTTETDRIRGQQRLEKEQKVSTKNNHQPGIDRL
jgi:hypothetical protein